MLPRIDARGYPEALPVGPHHELVELPGRAPRQSAPLPQFVRLAYGQ